MSRKQTPSDFLKQIIGRPVVVKLNSGVDYRGENVFLKFLNYCNYSSAAVFKNSLVVFSQKKEKKRSTR